MTTPLDLWMGELPEDRRVVAVTGTKGKSTTTSMIAALAARYGMVAEVAGNIGTPVFAGGREPQVDFVVLEVSSYQAADLHHVPEVAVVTSLAEDHVDWHGSVERYVADKARVLANDGGVADVVFVASSVRDPHDLPGAALCDLRLVDVPPSQGLETPAHMLSNAALATAVVAHLTGQEVSVTEALAVAPRLESRLEVLAQGDTVWIDDALGSNPSATAAGLAWVRSFNQPAVVLLGGAERGVDVGPLRAEVAEWAPGTLRAIALPDNGSELAARAGIEVLASASSVREAVALAGAKVPSGAVVLFSPSAPTPKAQGTWRERSAELRAAIEELHDERRHAGR